MDKFILEVFINEKKIYCKIYDIINISMCYCKLFFNSYICKSFIKIIIVKYLNSLELKCI